MKLQWTRYFKGFDIGRIIALRLCRGRLTRFIWIDGWLLGRPTHITLRGDTK